MTIMGDKTLWSSGGCESVCGLGAIICSLYRSHIKLR
jgi:hypothetical protein